MADQLSRPILIHICKDRTLSFRQRGEKVFNGRALPVFSVETEREAEDLLTLVGTWVGEDHPQLPPGRSWLKLFNGVGGNTPTLNLADLEEAADYLAQAYERIIHTRSAA